MTIITTQDYSQAVGTASVLILRDGWTNQIKPVYLRFWNVSTGIIWLSRRGPVVPGGLGAFPLQSMLYELFVTPQAIPGNAVWACADTGTSGTLNLTVEVG